MFIDIYEETLRDQNCFQQLNPEFPNVTFCYFGGSAPDTAESDQYNVFRLQSEIRYAIGYGSILTFGNPKKRSPLQFARSAMDNRELWAARSYYVTMLFYNVPRTFREAMAYDRRFHMSWSEKDLDFYYFTAQASVYDWWKFLQHKDDPGFRFEHRNILSEAWDMWNHILPALFQQGELISYETNRPANPGNRT